MNTTRPFQVVSDRLLEVVAICVLAITVGALAVVIASRAPDQVLLALVAQSGTSSPAKARLPSTAAQPASDTQAIK